MEIQDIVTLLNTHPELQLNSNTVLFCAAYHLHKEQRLRIEFCVGKVFAKWFNNKSKDYAITVRQFIAMTLQKLQFKHKHMFLAGLM